MSSMTMDRSMWSIDSRTIVYAAIGAALYGVLVGLFKIPVPGTTAVDARPAFALVPFFGFAFGPIVGLFTGLVGNMIGDQISGWGALTSYNWSIANGAVKSGPSGETKTRLTPSGRASGVQTASDNDFAIGFQSSS